MTVQLTDEQLTSLLLPALQNALRAKACLEAWGELTDHASKINRGHHAHFFAATQETFLNEVVLSLCKLYENPRDSAHSLPQVIPMLRATKQRQPLNRASSELTFIFGTKLPKTPAEFIPLLESSVPTKANSSALKGLVAVRDKFLAHQERMTPLKRNQYKWLPKESELLHLCDWAINACQAMLLLYLGGRAVLRFQSLKLATRNVLNATLRAP